MTPQGWRLVNSRAFFMQNVKDIKDDPLLEKIGADANGLFTVEFTEIGFTFVVSFTIFLFKYSK